MPIANQKNFRFKYVSGDQSEFQAIAFHILIGIDQLRIFDLDKTAMVKIEQHLSLFPNVYVAKWKLPMTAFLASTL